MFVTLLAAAAAVASASIDCSSTASVQRAWQPGIQAYQTGDMAKAKAVTDALIEACGDHPLGDFPRVMRAEIAVIEGDNDRALTTLGPRSRPAAAPIGPMSSLIALRAWQGKKDAQGFEEERARLLAASVKGLSEPGNPFKGKLIEEFEAGNVHVTALQTDFVESAFHRYFVFLLAPREPFAMPGSIMLSTDAGGDLLGGGPVYFVDEYGCWGHATLDMVPKRMPDYKAMKAKVLARLAGKLQPASSMHGGGACGLASYVAPGFAPPGP